MKSNNQRKPRTLGELITATYDSLGERRARGLVWLAVNTRLVKFHGPRQFVFSAHAI